MRLRRQFGFVKYYFREFQNRVLGGSDRFYSRDWDNWLFSRCWT
ncbi:MAG: hypothetical protein RXN78_06750 [Vulcanisaeta sp.]